MRKKKYLISIFAVLIAAGVLITAFFALKQNGAFAKAGEIDTDLITRAKLSGDVFGSEYPKESIETITFGSALENCPEEAWDISKRRDKSVMAWVAASDSGLYHLMIAGDGINCSITNCENMFDGYTEVTDISLNGCLDTSEAKNMEWMFAHCPKLTSIDLRGIDTSNANKMNCMFYECSSLETLDVSGFNTSNTIKMYGMFHSCESLTELDVSGFDTANVTEMDGMFDGCARLCTLNVGGFDTSKVTDMCGMFAGCEALRELDVSGFDTSRVTDMSGMFSHCSSLEFLDVSGFDLSSMETMRSMFENCVNLRNLDVEIFSNSQANKRDMFLGTDYE